MIQALRDIDSREVTVFEGELLELLKDLGVHGVGSDIGIGDGVSVLLGQSCARESSSISLVPVRMLVWVRLTLLGTSKVVILHVGTGTTIDTLLVTDDLGSERLGESTNGLTEVTLEELDDPRE